MTKKTKKQKRESKANQSILVRLSNPLLYDAFGDSFQLANTRYEPEEEESRIIHANLAYAIEFFLRYRSPQGQSLLINSQGDSDHAYDIAGALQEGRDEEVLEMSKGDHRWLLDKAKEHVYKVYPLDARMFLNFLEDVEEMEGEEVVSKEETTK